jgi:hypothetical protein
VGDRYDIGASVRRSPSSIKDFLFLRKFLAVIVPFRLTELLVALVIGCNGIWSMYGAVLGTLFAESCPANCGTPGYPSGQVGADIVGGPAPLIATAIPFGYDNNYVPVGIFLIACAIVSLIAISF